MGEGRRWADWKRERAAQLEGELRWQKREIRVLRALVGLEERRRAEAAGPAIFVEDGTGRCAICGAAVSGTAVHCMAHRVVQGVTAAERAGGGGDGKWQMAEGK